jgi:hypothetical protein
MLNDEDEESPIRPESDTESTKKSRQRLERYFEEALSGVREDR